MEAAPAMFFEMDSGAASCCFTQFSAFFGRRCPVPVQSGFFVLSNVAAPVYIPDGSGSSITLTQRQRPVAGHTSLP